MHELLHILGLCHDSFLHIDLLDIFVFIHEYNLNNLNNGVKKVYKQIIRK